MKSIQVCLSLVILCILLIVLPLTVRAEDDLIAWNTMPLEPAPSQIILKIQKSVSSVVPVSWEEVPKSLEIEFLGIQGSQILLVFEKNVKRNTYVCVFDVEGNYLYGYRLKKSHNDTQFALSPDRDGILILDWRVAERYYPGILVLCPDGIEEYYFYHSNKAVAIDDYSSWKSDYTLVDRKNGQVIISNKETGENRIVVDYSKEFLQYRPKQTAESISKKKQQDRITLLIVALITCCGSVLLPRLAKRDQK